MQRIVEMVRLPRYADAPGAIELSTTGSVWGQLLLLDFDVLCDVAVVSLVPWALFSLCSSAPAGGSANQQIAGVCSKVRAALFTG